MPQRTDKQLAQLIFAVVHNRQHDPKAVAKELKSRGLTEEEIVRGTAYLDSNQPILGR
ncbi:hypothetical protein ACFWFX_10065 [Streptomyces roseolus]|uniref:hypothetical protein n=1 Tax=Streptomyces roseolus TaxID=67358 RepID=UPI0036681DD4